MEIRYNLTKDSYNLEFNINDKNIIGVTGIDENLFARIISLKDNFTGDIYLDDKKLDTKDLFDYSRKISIIDPKFDSNLTVDNYFDNLIRDNNLVIKDPISKKSMALKMVGLKKVYLERLIYTLSTTEKFLITFAGSLLSNPDILIFIKPFRYLDLNYLKKMNLLLTKLNNDYHKIIIIVDNDSNKLYKYTSKMIFIKNKKVISTTNTYEDISFIKKNNYTMPDIIEFITLAKKKCKYIEYHKDIRDLIKDIYRHI